MAAGKHPWLARTPTDWPRQRDASIRAPLAAGGRASVYPNGCLPLEATRPGLLGTPGLVFLFTAGNVRRRCDFPYRPIGFINTTTGRRNAGRAASGIGAASKRSQDLPDHQQHHDDEHDIDDLAACSGHRCFPPRRNAFRWRCCQTPASKLAINPRFAAVAAFRC